MQIQRQKIESSHLKEIGYEEDVEVMDIQFHNGSVYRYFDVQKDVYDALMNDVSPGTFFHRHVRGWYEYRSLPPDKDVTT